MPITISGSSNFSAHAELMRSLMQHMLHKKSPQVIYTPNRKDNISESIHAVAALSLADFKYSDSAQFLSSNTDELVLFLNTPVKHSVRCLTLHKWFVSLKKPVHIIQLRTQGAPKPLAQI